MCTKGTPLRTRLRCGCIHFGAVAVAVVATVVVVLTVTHAVAVAAAAAAFVAIMGAVIWAMRWVASPRRLRQQLHPRAAVRVYPAAPARAISAPPRAIEASRVIPARVIISSEERIPR